jgi:hypothetical protein
MPLFLFLNTQTMHIESIVHNRIVMSSVPKADAIAMSTAPRRQGDQGDKISLWKKRLKFSLTIFCQKLLQNSYNI